VLFSFAIDAWRRGERAPLRPDPERHLIASEDRTTHRHRGREDVMKAAGRDTAGLSRGQ